MKPHAFATIAGASCLLATYNLTREGNITLALIVVAIIGVVCGLIAVAFNGNKSKLQIGLLSFSFSIGALISELVAFTNYYLTYGYQDPKLSVGVVVSLLEFSVISIVGGLATFSAAFAAKL